MEQEEPAELRGLKYPAKKHALKVKEHFISKKGQLLENKSAFFIAGETLKLYAYCDETYPLRQNR